MKCLKDRLTRFFHKHDVINNSRVGFLEKKSAFGAISNDTDLCLIRLIM